MRPLFIDFPCSERALFPFFDGPPNFSKLEAGPNDSSIQRGDREETGDNEAREDEMGSGPAQPTVDPTALGAHTSIRHPRSDAFDPESEMQDYDGLEIVPKEDRSLGLTDVPGVPAEDWAADTGRDKAPGRKQ
ncbi:MAG: hypothetical protein JO033_11580 [Acidobacteriaceae bacterium]|nr:hypothetical protein [Acidobacteriaceae bacterium]MBV9498194.1 hypothetical protein [Acidobacteriaceae bacterium]